jgi:hypothetical protein
MGIRVVFWGEGSTRINPPLPSTQTPCAFDPARGGHQTPGGGHKKPRPGFACLLKALLARPRALAGAGQGGHKETARDPRF